jgi:hypothetical protein
MGDPFVNRFYHIVKTIFSDFLAYPLQNIDILIIDEMGKDISGAGIAEEPELPKIKRIIINDLTEASEGNAVGVGLADFVTRRLFDKISMEATYLKEFYLITLKTRLVQFYYEISNNKIKLAVI